MNLTSVFIRSGLIAILCIFLSATDSSAQNNRNENEGDLLVFAEQMPEFPGGNEALVKFLNTNLQYPAISKSNKSQGRIILSFVVGTDGSLDDITNLSLKADSLLVDEAIRVVKLMPNWKPGKQNGKPVKVKLTMPIVFKLD